MNSEELNSYIGIVASLVTILAAIFATMRYFKNRSLAKEPLAEVNKQSPMQVSEITNGSGIQVNASGNAAVTISGDVSQREPNNLQQIPKNIAAPDIRLKQIGLEISGTPTAATHTFQIKNMGGTVLRAKITIEDNVVDEKYAIKSGQTESFKYKFLNRPPLLQICISGIDENGEHYRQIFSASLIGGTYEF